MKWTPLVITVTCDPSLQDPLNPRIAELNPSSQDQAVVDALAKEYIDANAAGATMDHVHGFYSRDPVVPSGTRPPCPGP